MQPFVVDIYHGNLVGQRGFIIAKAAGVIGIIHKATQGVRVNDDAYATRRRQATNAGLLWGAYHFNTGDDVAAQVDHFFMAADPDDQIRMALDFEDNTASEMSIQQCADFLGLADQKLGRKLTLYGGNRIREQLPKAGKDTQAFIASHPLWLCQYGPVARIPAPWTKYFLWQFTGDGVGPPPHTIPGFAVDGLDINTYAGTAEQLAAEWAT